MTTQKNLSSEAPSNKRIKHRHRRQRQQRTIGITRAAIVADGVTALPTCRIGEEAGSTLIAFGAREAPVADATAVILWGAVTAARTAARVLARRTSPVGVAGTKTVAVDAYGTGQREMDSQF